MVSSVGSRQIRFVAHLACCPLLLATAGCRLLLPYEGGEGGGRADARPSADVPLQDTRPSGDALPQDDAVPRDAFPQDDAAPQDASPQDVYPQETASADLGPPVDGAAGDQLIDGAPVDALSADQGLPALGCVSGYASNLAVSTTPGARMTACTYGDTFNQCAAAARCDALAGWHLCTGAEYLARGGAASMPAPMAWIGVCVRQGAEPIYAPGPCPRCSFLTDANPPFLGEICSNNTATQFTAQDLAMHTWMQLRTPVKGDLAKCGYWTPTGSATLFGGAMCCD